MLESARSQRFFSAVNLHDFYAVAASSFFIFPCLPHVKKILKIIVIKIRRRQCWLQTRKQLEISGAFASVVWFQLKSKQASLSLARPHLASLINALCKGQEVSVFRQGISTNTY